MEDVIGQQTLDIMSGARHYNQWLWEKIKPYIGNRVAEVGAGTGTFIQKLVDSGHVVTALDKNQSYVKLIRDNFSKVDTEVLDLQTKKVPTQLLNKFDTVIALNVIEHIPDAHQAIVTIGQLLKPTGKVVILVPSGKWAYGSLDEKLGHMTRFDKEQLTNLIAKAGLKVVSLRYLNLLGLLGWWWNSRVTNRQVLPSNQVKLFDIFSAPFLWLENYLEFPIGLSLLVVAEK